MPASQIHAVAPEVLFPTSVKEALAILDQYPGDAKIVGGATWLMRAGFRGDKLPAILVSLSRIKDIDAVVEREKGWTIGPMVTHECLAGQFGSGRALRALGQAAGMSANPGVRRLATLGGNLATEEFAAADLVPALIVLDASVTVAHLNGKESLAVEEFLGSRALMPDPSIVTGVEIKADRSFSAHVRQTMRAAGEYPAAIVSIAAKLSGNHKIETVRIAVGSVEPKARRWRSLESELAGRVFDLAGIEGAAKAKLADFSPREGVDVPSWYRLEILPHLVRGAFTEIEKQVRG